MFLPFLAKAPVLVNGKYVEYVNEYIIDFKQVHLFMLISAALLLVGFAIVTFVLYRKAKNKPLVLGTGVAWLLLEAFLVNFIIRGLGIN
ncbi:MAG: hypothetical protein LBS41_06690 [Streptococcaceae bacterium]|jgi:hypothetical protein|nr:hypothetical protein [Streptococcaceae bacterium]